MIIERKEYLEKLIAWKDKQLIKIVTGGEACVGCEHARGTGSSWFLVCERNPS